MKNPIYPCLWFNGNAKEGAKFYCSVFYNSSIVDENPFVSMVKSSGQKFMCFNGGPEFAFNPSVSFFVVCETEEETDKTWNKLLERGTALMPLGKYDWSSKYGWVEDRFGVSWQISYSKMEDVGQKFTPSLMFTGKQHGKAEEAIQYYTSLFKNSGIVGILKYTKEENDVAGTVKHAQFTLNKNVFMAMDSALMPQFSFNEAISFVVECESQEEIDYFWSKFTAEGEEGQCGWLKDKFSVPWQIIPAILRDLMNDTSKSERVINAFMQMKKFDIQKLREA